MKKQVSLVLFPVLALGIFVGINAFMSSASWEWETRYDCVYNYDDNGGYNCYPDSEWEYDCSSSTSVCKKDVEDGDDIIINSCEWQYGESEWDWEWEEYEEWYYYCKPKYDCEWEYGGYHCHIKNGGWYYCYIWEEWERDYCKTIEGWLSNYFCWSNWGEIEWYSFDCNATYNIISETDTWYYFTESWWGIYSCMAPLSMGPRGGYNLWRYSCRDQYDEEAYQGCIYKEWEYNEGGDIRWFSEDSFTWYFCPKLYSYQVDRENGVYNFYGDNSYWYEKYICDSVPDWWYDEEGGEDERGNIESEYYCYNPGDYGEKYNSCTKNSFGSSAKWSSSLRSSNWEYSCPISYYCYEDGDWFFCEEDNYWNYYCRVNDDNSETYSCFLWWLDNPLSNSCTVVEDDEDEDRWSPEDSFIWFFCPLDVETFTITIGVNNDSYWSINPSWAINIASWTAILVDENNVLTIWSNEVTATPTVATPEYTYIFTGWTNNCGNELTGDCTITANFSRTAKEYTITFVDWNTTYVYTWTVWSTVIAPNWLKEWYSLSWDRDIPTTMVAENLTINASWTINSYTITFYLNWWSGTIEPVTQNYNTEISEPTEPTKEWYTFAGWYDWNSKVTFPYRVPASNKTLTAHWNWGNSWWNGWYSWWGGRSWWSNPNNQKDDNKPSEDKPVVNPQSTWDNKKLDEKPSQKDDKQPEEDNKPENWNNDWWTNTPKDEEPKYTQETLDAYGWAYANWLTKYSNIKDARLDEYMNRSEMAKISTIFATEFRWETPDESKREFCSKFSDLWKVEEDTKEYIIQSCELWNMWYQANGVDELQRFRPYTPVSVAETSIILSRMMWWNKYAVSENKWYQWHLWAVYEHRLIDNISNPFNNITRKDAFVMLYRLSFSNDVIRN